LCTASTRERARRTRTDTTVAAVELITRGMSPMDELITLVTQKAGIPADKAKLAVTAVLGYLKGRLPGPVAGQIDSLVGGGAGAETGGLGDVAKRAGGMLGGSEGRPEA
jgi:septal ring factor EnvC (AmiA/AmiB activator)